MPAPFPLSLALAGLLLLAPAAATAQAQVPFAGLAADRDAPVELSAETLKVDQAAGTALFTGEVLAVQGGLRLAADRLRVDYARSEGDGRNRIARLHATGNVTLTTPEDAAEAQEALYDLDAGRITLSGDVLLTQGGNALAGDRLVLDLETSAGRMEGRVRSVILPDSRP